MSLIYYKCPRNCRYVYYEIPYFLEQHDKVVSYFKADRCQTNEKLLEEHHKSIMLGWRLSGKRKDEEITNEFPVGMLQSKMLYVLAGFAGVIPIGSFADEHASGWDGDAPYLASLDEILKRNASNEYPKDRISGIPIRIIPFM